MSTLTFSTTRAFRPVINGKPSVPLVAVEHWNGLDKLVDGTGRMLIVAFNRDNDAMEALGFPTDGGINARVVSGSPELLAELGVKP